VSLRLKQSQFVKMVAMLINYATMKGFDLTFSDALATEGHSNGSFHYIRLAIDLNLFKDGEYLTETHDHEELGVYWESIGGTWGGRFKDPDGNHYSLGEIKSIPDRQG